MFDEPGLEDDDWPRDLDGPETLQMLRHLADIADHADTCINGISCQQHPGHSQTQLGEIENCSAKHAAGSGHWEETRARKRRPSPRAACRAGLSGGASRPPARPPRPAGRARNRSPAHRKAPEAVTTVSRRQPPPPGRQERGRPAAPRRRWQRNRIRVPWPPGKPAAACPDPTANLSGPAQYFQSGPGRGRHGELGEFPQQTRPSGALRRPEGQTMSGPGEARQWGRSAGPRAPGRPGKCHAEGDDAVSDETAWHDHRTLARAGAMAVRRGRRAKRCGQDGPGDGAACGR